MTEKQWLPFPVVTPEKRRCYYVLCEIGLCVAAWDGKSWWMVHSNKILVSVECFKPTFTPESILCKTCGGSGGVDLSDYETDACPDCFGKGYIYVE